MSQGRNSSPRSAPIEAMAEDFLYHLYRGSEFLADGRYDGAREELDLALRLQPSDPAAQDLLAKLYFRLGVYPRAIELYAEIVRHFPDRIPPRINLALAYLKTGQMREVVAHLLPVIEREPGHVRAWGYLGLAWSRLGEYAKAREAFVRAGHEGMARRMEEALQAQYGAGPSLLPLSRPSIAEASAPEPSAQDDEPISLLSPPIGTTLGAHDRAEMVRRVAASAFEEIERVQLGSAALAIAEEQRAPSPGSWTALEIGDASKNQAASVQGLAEFAQRAALAPRGGALELDGATLVVVGGCAARLDARALGAALERGEPLRRGTSGALLLGEPRLAWIRSGWVAIPPRRGLVRVLLALRDESLSVREESLLAFEGTLSLATVEAGEGDDALPIALLSGRGRVALELPGALRTIAVTPNAPLTLPREALVAWSGALAVGPRRCWEDICLEVAGEGVVFVSLPEAPGGAS